MRAGWFVVSMSTSPLQEIEAPNRTVRVLRRVPGLRLANRYLRHGLYRRVRVELEFLLHALRHGYGPAIWRRLIPSRTRSTEQVVHWPTSIPDVADGDALAAWFRGQGLRVDEGWHAFYLPPQPGLAQVLGEAVSAYPDNAGFKVLKSLGDVEQARYIRSPRQPWLKRRVIGNPLQQVEAIRYLHQLGLGPELYALVTLQVGGVKATAFVMEHLKGGQPSEAEYGRFMDRLEKAFRTTELAKLPEWGAAQHDFVGPDCNGNLMLTGDQRETGYVDFQNFVLKHPRS
ncbi:MAG: hypothetical protein ACE5Q6_17395 [Dehalococcoidia bacterium]